MNYSEFITRARERASAHTRLYVLVACEESQRTCISFRELGHIASSAQNTL